MSVQLLLSTYNGEAYLRPLLDSLLAQDYADLTILVRDDGSDDITPALLQEYAARSNNIEIVCGEHRGFIASYFSLLRMASPQATYVALCDQDDVWRPDKLSRAVNRLALCAADVPALYCSRLLLTDGNLRPLGFSEIPKRALAFRNALVENQAAGCTMVLNAAARRLLAQAPSACISHDWWIYLAVSAYGLIAYDPEPAIYYRKHSANTIGMSFRSGEMWRIKVTRFLRDWNLHQVVKQAEEFRRLHAAFLPNEPKQVLDRFLESRKTFLDRLRYAFSCDVYRQSALDQCILRARIALDCL